MNPVETESFFALAEPGGFRKAKECIAEFADNIMDQIDLPDT